MQNIRLYPAALVMIATLHSGCVNISTEVPGGWDRAMSRPASSIAGTYQTAGEQTIKEHGGATGGAHLAVVFNAVTADQDFCPRTDLIRLRPIGRDQLELTALNGTEVVATKTLAADIGAETSLDGVTKARKMKRTNGPVSDLKTHEDVVLMRGPDGYLYVQIKHRATAKLGGIVPFGGGGETWLRFPPATSDHSVK